MLPYPAPSYPHPDPPAKKGDAKGPEHGSGSWRVEARWSAGGGGHQMAMSDNKAGTKLTNGSSDHAPRAPLMPLGELPERAQTAESKTSPNASYLEPLKDMASHMLTEIVHQLEEQISR
eukprot:gnl/TRDRNA2_/TRDRNA2_65149_c0_seq1.p1 gnl/TRDRNA2_/TRDRNA2_65149_c0~~gnl/TRDRNA2_/TRDRNA2_65149_c0_seq1.p1  ORF type:complete len:119 (+),score=10.15 gnl/TRDRNA2_/TRDRNA2_65149_c0_seq1:121-477(+)